MTNNESTVAATSSFVIGGVTRTISEVWFRNDAMDTRYQGDVTLDVRTLFLPTLKGFGNLKDLHVANDNQKIGGVIVRRMYDMRLAG